MKISTELKAFQERLGHSFKSPELLIRAVTHSSLSTSDRSDNQRLEFLGDRVLGLIIAEALLKADPKAAEGILAPRFNALVRKETCAEVAAEIDLGMALKMGRSEMISGGRRKQAILGDAMEAVIAAVYLDAGFGVATKLVLKLWGARILNTDIDARDSKTVLQEWAQARGMPPPSYRDLDRKGPDHAPVFKVEAVLADGQRKIAEANSKRAAQQLAAKQLLESLSDE